MSDVSNDVSNVDTPRRATTELIAAPGFTPTAKVATGRGAVSQLAVRPDGGLLIATHYGDDSFSLIDPHDGTVRQTVVDVGEPFAVAMSGPSTGRAYLSSASLTCDSVLAFDVDAKHVVASYPLTGNVVDVAVSPNGRRVYIGRSGADGAGVAILDSATGDEHATSVGSAGTVTECLQLSAGGRYLYAATNGALTAELVTVDTWHNRVLCTTEIGSPIRDIALSPDGASVYVGSCGPDFGSVLDVVDVRDARRCAVTATYKIGDVAGALSRLTVSRDGSRAYLVGEESVTVLCTTTQDVIGTVATGARPSCAVESPAGDRLYIADYAGAVTVLAVDPAAAPATQSHKVVASHQVVADLQALAASPA